MLSVDSLSLSECWKYLPHLSCFKVTFSSQKPLTTRRQASPKTLTLESFWVNNDQSLCCVKSHISSQNSLTNINKGTFWQSSIVFKRRLSNLRNMDNFKKYLHLMSSLQQKNRFYHKLKNISKSQAFSYHLWDWTVIPLLSKVALTWIHRVLL